MLRNKEHPWKVHSFRLHPSWFVKLLGLSSMAYPQETACSPGRKKGYLSSLTSRERCISCCDCLTRLEMDTANYEGLGVIRRSSYHYVIKRWSLPGVSSMHGIQIYSSDVGQGQTWLFQNFSHAVIIIRAKMENWMIAYLMKSSNYCNFLSYKGF